jgi:hypothetical protein
MRHFTVIRTKPLFAADLGNRLRAQQLSGATKDFPRKTDKKSMAGYDAVDASLLVVTGAKETLPWERAGSWVRK